MTGYLPFTLIQKITVYKDRFTVEFKSGISVDITE
jgi:hypothetical protein